MPSIVARVERNVLIHPYHDEAGSISVGLETPVCWDSCLFARQENYTETPARCLVDDSDDQVGAGRRFPGDIQRRAPSEQEVRSVVGAPSWSEHRSRTRCSTHRT